MLKIVSLKSYYESICALKAVSLHVQKGEIVTLIGANGSGKSTLLHTVTGLMSRISGSIKFEGSELIGRPPAAIVKLGIALIPEGRQLFYPMSVMDNLILGTYAYRSLRDKKKLHEKTEWIFEHFPVLKTRKSIARALMSDPKLLLLDEPSMGLAPKIVEIIFETLIELKEKADLTIFLVEQNAKLALEICQRGYVIETGQIILSGDRNELMHNKEVLRAYLGGE
jgi:branched-chain amino acid transport system ATP-binding protein